MGHHYRHINSTDRLKIYELLFQGKAIADIAEIVGFHRSSLYRELNRNSSTQGYRPDWATQQYHLRRQAKSRKIDTIPELKDFIISKLYLGWSPESISGRLKIKSNKSVISTESIYRFIYSKEGLSLKLYKLLQQKRRFRYPKIKRRRKTIAKDKKNPIKQRDDSINKRENLGHWEGDLILFKKTKTNLITLRERKSRFIVAIKNLTKKAACTRDNLVKYMKQKQLPNMQSLTLDNGSEFALHNDISKQLNAKVYFCEPYKSYQKGAIENANKLIRTKLPKRVNIDAFHQADIDKIIENFNDRPMRCLNYLTPREALMQASA